MHALHTVNIRGIVIGAVPAFCWHPCAVSITAFHYNHRIYNYKTLRTDRQHCHLKFLFFFHVHYNKWYLFLGIWRDCHRVLLGKACGWRVFGWKNSIIYLTDNTLNLQGCQSVTCGCCSSGAASGELGGAYCLFDGWEPWGTSSEGEEGASGLAGWGGSEWSPAGAGWNSASPPVRG